LRYGLILSQQEIEIALRIEEVTLSHKARTGVIYVGTVDPIKKILKHESVAHCMFMRKGV
jgi:hypothetical protein